jgi:hypothetical protein
MLEPRGVVGAAGVALQVRALTLESFIAGALRNTLLLSQPHSPSTRSKPPWSDTRKITSHAAKSPSVLLDLGHNVITKTASTPSGHHSRRPAGTLGIAMRSAAPAKGS